MKKTLKEKFSENKGVTLTALVITIIVLVIIAAIAIPEGKTAIENAKLTTFTSEMQAMQQEVNKLNQRLNSGDESVKNLGYSLQGTTQENTAFYGADVAYTAGYRYYKKDTIESLGLQDFSQEFLVNVEKRMVISLQGINYNGNKYYTTGQLPNGLYNVKYEGVTSEITFDLGYINENGKQYLKLTNIHYDGNINKGTIYYGQGSSESDINWKIAANNTSDDSIQVEVPNAGIWYVEIVDVAGNNSVIKVIEILE